MELAAALDSAEIPYMVVGGQAVLLYGEPRLTRDIDITLGVSSDDLSKVLEAFRGLRIRLLPQDPQAFVRSTMTLPIHHEVSGVRIDLIFSFSTFERDAIRRVNRIQVGAGLVNYVSLEDLIVMKIIAGRPRDLEDVRAILRRNPNGDREQIRESLALFRDVLDEDPVSRFDNTAKESGR